MYTVVYKYRDAGCHETEEWRRVGPFHSQTAANGYGILHEKEAKKELMEAFFMDEEDLDIFYFNVEYIEMITLYTVAIHYTAFGDECFYGNVGVFSSKKAANTYMNKELSLNKTTEKITEETGIDPRDIEEVNYLVVPIENDWEIN